MQWPKDNDLRNTTQNTCVFKLLVKKDIQCNGQKTMIYETLLKTRVFKLLVKKDRQCNGQKTMITKHYSEHWCLQTVSEDGQTMQWPKENDLQNTSQNTDVFKLLVKDIQCNVQKTMIYKTLLRTLVSSNF